MVALNKSQIAKVGELLKKLPEGSGLNFYSFKKGNEEIIALDMYPKLNHPQAINFFFFVVMHDYGFWYGDEKGYYEPLYGTINGKREKGSDLLWKMSMAALNKNETQFEPAKLAKIKPMELAQIFSDDNGPIVWPDFEKRFQMTRASGKWFIEEKTSPSEIVILANSEEGPLKEFLWWTRKIPGYNRDLAEKKNLLLAMVLANRPEKFLNVKDPENWRPIVDYHLMRVSLRMGLVELNKEEKRENKERKWIAYFTEREIRWAVYNAVLELIQKSGRPMSFIDKTMWMGRRYCPEMTAPDCSKCLFDSVCKKRVELFQPVFRTTAY